MKVFIPHNHRRCQVCSQGFFADSPICFEAVGERETLVNHKTLANHEASIKSEALVKYETRAKIVPTDKAEGYDGIMQGGIVTTLHDSAMLHCLFQNSINAMTVSLTSRFHHPIAIGQELEALRLADQEGLSQLEAAEQMQVSRQTFGNIIKRARAKVAKCIVNGHALVIQGA